MRSYLNENELEALRGLPHPARTLYREGLRPYMDFETGLVGTNKRKISYQQFKELLEVNQDTGAHTDTWRPTISAMRNLFKLLLRCGLIVKVKQEKRTAPMIYKLILADIGQIRPQEERHRSDIGGATEGRPGCIRDTEEFDQRSDRGATYEERHTSVTSDKTPHHARGGSFPISLEWDPNPEQIASLARRAGVDIALMTPALLTKFKSYWEGRGEVNTEGVWHSKLLSDLLHAKARAKQDEKYQSSTRSSSERKEAVNRSIYNYNDATKF